MELECTGVVLTDPVSGAVLCQNGSGAAVAWVVTPSFDFTAFDTSGAGEAFAAGFVLVGSCWAIGKAVGLILSVIRR